TGRVDPFYSVLGGLALALHVARGMLTQEASKRLIKRLNVTLLDKQLREMRSPRETLASRFHLFQCHVHALLSEGICQLAIPIAPVFPFAPEPTDKLR